jgi:putative flippase GtrA/SAM-dependent methyltransferase
MLTRLFSIFEGKHYRYLLVGVLVFIINTFVARLIFSYHYFNGDYWKQNLGNLLALEVALLISYPLHKFITWLEGWDHFFSKLIHFHLVSVFAISIRILIFALLIKIGFGWFLATLLSVGCVVLINFAGFDRFVFSREKEIFIENQLGYSLEGQGVETLETIEEATSYNRWIAGKISDFLGVKNLELGAGTGTIAAITSEIFPLELFDLSEHNQNILKNRFLNHPNVKTIGKDILSNVKWDSYDCVYSSNVMEHIEDDTLIVNHSLRLLKKGGFFIAIVPALPILYSAFDKKIGHFRRYSKRDIKRWHDSLNKDFQVRWIKSSYFNPIGALGWFVKMKILGQTRIYKQDAMIINSLIPFIGWLDYLPLPFGQSMLIVIKKL